MDYEGNIIRPPSEANSIILQATVGCSHNACTFCGAYRDKKFRVKDEATILGDLAFAATYCRRQSTLFLADGNALAIPQSYLVHLLGLIRQKLPWVRRIAMYANSRDVLRRSPEEMRQLRELGVGRLYLGLESGDPVVLKNIGKGAGPEDMVRAAEQVRQARIFLSVTVLLGVGGKELSMQHARATAEVINAMQPNQIAVLTLMILENTPLGRKHRDGIFQMPGQQALFAELRTLLTGIKVQKAQFQANHASNYFSLDGRLPRDKQQFTELIDAAIAGSISLKPEQLRAL